MFIFHFPLMTKRPCFVFSGSHVLINHHRCILARPDQNPFEWRIYIKILHFPLSVSLPCCSFLLTETWRHVDGSFCIWQNLLNIHEEFKSRPMALWYFNNMTTTNPKWFVDISNISKMLISEMGNYISTSHNPFTTGGNWIVGIRNLYSYEWKMNYWYLLN